MADNTFNFDLDAPAVPTLTLDPHPRQKREKGSTRPSRKLPHRSSRR